jgi:hypothetical protein
MSSLAIKLKDSAWQWRRGGTSPLISAVGWDANFVAQIGLDHGEAGQASKAGLGPPIRSFLLLLSAAGLQPQPSSPEPCRTLEACLLLDRTQHIHAHQSDTKYNDQTYAKDQNLKCNFTLRELFNGVGARG